MGRIWTQYRHNTDTTDQIQTKEKQHTDTILTKYGQHTDNMQTNTDTIQTTCGQHTEEIQAKYGLNVLIHRIHAKYGQHTHTICKQNNC